MVGAVAGQPRSPQLQCNTLSDIPLTLSHLGPLACSGNSLLCRCLPSALTSHPHPAPSCSGPEAGLSEPVSGQEMAGSEVSETNEVALG